MPLRQVQLPGQQSIADELYEYVRHAILTGDVLPGERLVENAVAEVANVSRTPVREALNRLEVSGLVRDSGNGGMEVCDFSLDEMADLCAVREALEGMATGLAATSRSDMDLAMLESLVNAEESMLADDASIDVLVSLNHSFHERLWHASRNRYLMAQLQKLRELIEGLQGSTLRLPERQAEAIAEHRAIVEAVRRRDGDGAAEVARLHFRHAMSARLVMNAEQLAAAARAGARPSVSGRARH